MEPVPLSTSSTESGNKNYRETTSALEPHNIPTRPGNNRFSEIKPLPLAKAPQSQETKIAVKQLCSGATQHTDKASEEQ